MTAADLATDFALAFLLSFNVTLFALGPTAPASFPDRFGAWQTPTTIDKLHRHGERYPLSPFWMHSQLT